MANELVHASAGTVLTQAEFEAIGLHVLNNQATGDLIYASSASQLSRLGIGATNTILQVIAGIPAWVTNPTIASPTFTGTVIVDANQAGAFPDTNAYVLLLKGWAGGNQAYTGIRFAMHEHTSGWGADIQGFDDTGDYGGALVFRTGTGSPTGTPTERIRIASTATANITFSNCLIIPNLPTSNPGAGKLWNDSGTVKVGT